MEKLQSGDASDSLLANPTEVSHYSGHTLSAKAVIKVLSLSPYSKQTRPLKSL
jgi:hypothetical protein